MINAVNKRIDDIRPYERNPRDNDRAVRHVAESIERFGFKVPIVIDREGVIITGHTRYKAAKRIGLDKVPCIVADDLTEEQAREFRIADNKVAEASEWDDGLLAAELAALEEAGVDMDGLGFSDEADEGPGPQGNAAGPEEYEPGIYAVSVSCSDERDQEETFERLSSLGYECKVVVL